MYERGNVLRTRRSRRDEIPPPSKHHLELGNIVVMRANWMDWVLKMESRFASKMTRGILVASYFILALGDMSGAQPLPSDSPPWPQNSSSFERKSDFDPSLSRPSPPNANDDQTPNRDLESLRQAQKQIREILPRILPCVVAVEGGSGVVVSEDGLILTASHVAGRSGRTVKVFFPNGRVEEAITLGTNNHTDASAMKLIRSGPWPYLSLSKGAEIEIGDWCLALGYPSGFSRGTDAAVRMGQIQKIGEQELATGCPLMGGDSGGALVNLKGELVGIHSRVKNGISENFHIPIAVFLKEKDNIAASANVRQRLSPSRQRAYLGLHAESDFERVRIRSVHSASPAKIAGLEPEDVILEFDGRRIANFDEILNFVEGRQPGEEVNIIVNRFGRLLRFAIILGSQY
jgi:serine protease Do